MSSFSLPAFSLALALSLALLALLALLFLRRRRRASLAHLRGRHVWVIGASRGLGRAIALLCARHGASVSISSRHLSSLTPVATLLGPQLAACVPLDVSSPWPALAAALSLVEAFAPLDVLVLNAGLNHAGANFLALSPAQIDTVLATNLVGLTRLLSLALPRMLAAPPPRPTRKIALVSSLAAYRGLPGGSVYAATKAAVTSLAQSLRVELYHHDVDVVPVHPGFVDTDAIRHLNHPKPFIVSEDHAAREVIHALLRGDPHYAFPWPMQTIVMPFARLLPDPIYEFVLFHTNR